MKTERMDACPFAKPAQESTPIIEWLTGMRFIFTDPDIG
jgi:hypothetical protein